jgi:hypothetical protein
MFYQKNKLMKIFQKINITHIFDQISRKPIYFLFLSILIILLFKIFGPFETNPLYSFGGEYIRDGISGKLFPGWPTIEPNILSMILANGYRSSVEVFNGNLPLWNHYVGFGQPLLATMQSAALFPFTWLYYFPNGLLITHALLQFIGGLGSFLFFKKVGLNNKAAFFGAFLFQFNGIFAWLQNACFNPIAFFPWLLYSFESIYQVIKNGVFNFIKLKKYIITGIITATLAVYSGFPEIVYLYSLFLFSWILLRLFELTNLYKKLYFSLIIFLIALTALFLSFPAMITFYDFTEIAFLGGHQGDGYSKAHLSNWSLLQYIFPYITGGIFSRITPLTLSIWGSIGGYILLMPLIFAILGILFFKKNKVIIFLVSWIIFCLCVSHSLPYVHDLFYSIQIHKIIPAYRYLNIIWIFSIIYISSIFVNYLTSTNTFPKYEINSKLRIAIKFISLPLVVICFYFFAKEVDPFNNNVHSLGYLLFFIIVIYFLIFKFDKEKLKFLIIIALLEAYISFFAPITAYPLNVNKDLGLVNFLKDNIGRQSFVSFPGQGDPIIPNLGAYFGIKQLNYNDFPSPSETINYINMNLDPYGAFLFLPDFPPGQNYIDRQNYFLKNLESYAKAGVKYFVTRNDVLHELPTNFYNTSKLTSLHEDSDFNKDFQFEISSKEAISISGIKIWIDNINNSSDGELYLKICSHNNCSTGQLSLQQSINQDYNQINLDKPLDIKNIFSLNISRNNSTKPVSFRMQKSLSNNEDLIWIKLLRKISLIPVYEEGNFSVFEINNYKKYFTHPGCTSEELSFDHLKISCSRDSYLERLEYNAPIWTATINGKMTEVKPLESFFQRIKLSKGYNEVIFTYKTKNQKLFNLFWLGLLMLSFVLLYRNVHIKKS